MKRSRFTEEQIFGILKEHQTGLRAAWRDDYNHLRSHTSLDGLTLREFLNRSIKDQTLNMTNF